MIRQGRDNLITDVPGILVGNAADEDLRSGVTVVLPEESAVAAADVRGGGPGTRETDLLNPSSMVERVHAVVLSGGSAFGLQAADGAMAWLAAQDRGFKVDGAVVPIVPTAILFDLSNGGNKAWGDTPPYAALARQACETAGRRFELGNVGAGYGARAGRLKGGLGSASAVDEDGVAVGALAAVNSHGSVVMPGSPAFWTWALERDGEFGGAPPPNAPLTDLAYVRSGEAATNTTLVVVATDAVLTRVEAQRMAIMAQDGIARAIRPVHTPFDGDSVFVLATGCRDLRDPLADLARIGTMAADCTARAIARGVYAAQTLGEVRSYRDTFGNGRDTGEQKP